MQKIMFNDKYGLTAAVLAGRKTMTRRIVPEVVADKLIIPGGGGLPDCPCIGLTKYYRYKVGEVVGVAQNYKDAMEEIGLDGSVHPLVATPGYRNKMFVRADLMPYQIRITTRRVERLQDISDEDCLREGITTITEGKLGVGNAFGWDTKADRLKRESFFSARAAFAALIDKVSGKGTWERNPWVFVYEFELIK